MANKIYCSLCKKGFGSASAKQQHINDSPNHENVCTECDKHFDSPDNLRHHKMTHLDSTVKCYGCIRMFKTYAAMILHLESGGCCSGIDLLDLNKSAAECPKWRIYLDEDYRADLLAGQDLREQYYDIVHPFECPKCDGVFAKLSGLCQHVGSESCAQRLNKGALGKLVRYLSDQYEQG